MGKRWALLVGLLPMAFAAPKPSDWVPARWPWTTPASLELLAGSPVNCLLVRDLTPEFASAAAERGIATLALLQPGDDASKALAAKPTGLALDGEFSEAAISA